MPRNKPKKQHFVPQSYLKRFAGNDERIHVFDKVTKKTLRRTKVRNIAHENYFYDSASELQRKALNKTYALAEDALAMLDADLNEAIEIALNVALGGSGTLEQRQKMSLCTAIQIVRTRGYRDGLVQLAEELMRAELDAVLKLARPDLASKVRAEVRYDEQSIPMLHGRFLWDPHHIANAASILYHHIWVIGLNQTDIPFYTSDAPVVRQAHKQRSPYMPSPGGPAFEKAIDIAIEANTPGINAEGVEIIFPLNPECALIFLDRKYFKSIEHRDGHVYRLDAIQVQLYNRLQVLQSNRQIYSCSDDFNLAHEVCRQYPEICVQNYPRYRLNAYELGQSD